MVPKLFLHSIKLILSFCCSFIQVMLNYLEGLCRIFSATFLGLDWLEENFYFLFLIFVSCPFPSRWFVIIYAFCFSTIFFFNNLNLVHICVALLTTLHCTFIVFLSSSAFIRILHIHILLLVLISHSLFFLLLFSPATFIL